MHAPDFSSYRAGRAFWSVLHAYLLECFRGKVFNYFLFLLSRQLDGTAVFNNCPSYSTVTLYSFYVVLWYVLSSRVFLGFSSVWSSTPEWLMCQSMNSGILHYLPRPNSW
jgi:hypothetical protein